MAGQATDLEPRLRSGVAELGFALGDTQIRSLLAYLALIAKWTRVYNLTALREPADMLTHHLLDSLAAVPALRRQLAAMAAAPEAALLDVGAGAGLPGAVFAICFPGLRVTCVDTVAKKAAFIKQVALELTLPNLAGLHARVESLTQPFDIICSRAFASLADFTVWSAPALKVGGVWMALKGKRPDDEIAALPASIDVFHVEQLTVPGLAAERCIVWARPAMPGVSR
ncbi:MAG: 16S rRNA (guanine(527)-N(7))-methyltransferase RsmG [Polaromonas sp.]|nr:16S rRNA (guanine(527)-N(7))-methyltransferase RsmG [Polaromonas sp.]